MREQDTYKEVKIIQRPGFIVRVHIPDLTPEERAKRMKQVEHAAVRLLLSQWEGEDRRDVQKNLECPAVDG